MNEGHIVCPTVCSHHVAVNVLKNVLGTGVENIMNHLLSVIPRSGYEA